jgi:tetratricopeptide (TPR) repeat protein
MDPMGSSWRQYPLGEARKRIIEDLRQKADAQLTGDECWQLGEYQIIEGLSSGDESMINSGSQALLRGTQLEPPHAGCLLDLGWLLCYKGLDQMALFYLDKAVAIVPHSRDILALQGWASIGSGNREKALESFRKAVNEPEATEGDRQTLRELENGKPLGEMRRELVLRKFGDDSLLHATNVPEAARSGVQQLKQVLERKPEDIEIAYTLAHCYYVLDQFDHAEPLLHRVIGKDSRHADSLTLLALISMKRQQPELQLSYYERAVEADPRHVLANTNLASMYQDRGDYHRARPLLERAIEAAAPDDPHLPIALDLLGNNYGSIDLDFEKEVELHRRAIALDPRRPLFHANLATALLSAGRVKDAKRALEAAKDLRQVVPNEQFLENLIRLYQDHSLHPYEYMQFADKLSALLGWPAVRPLIQRAWEFRRVVKRGEEIAFLKDFGLMASHVHDNELALGIWKHGASLPGGKEFEVNVAVEMSNLDRHEEALACAAVMPMDTPRSWTILGNIRMRAGRLAEAIEAYHGALDRDERLLLPIVNAIECAVTAGLPNTLDPFIHRLQSDWQSSPVGACLLGHALAMQGRLQSAADCFKSGLWNKGEIRTPEDLWSSEHSEDDLSLLDSPTLSHHYRAAKYLLAAGRINLAKSSTSNRQVVVPRFS